MMPAPRIPRMIENHANDHGAERCGHNFPIMECPYRRCGSRATREALRRLCDSLATFIRESHDLGAEALAALYEAQRLL